MHDNILTAMCLESVLTVGRMQRFARRARDCGRAYIALQKEVGKGDPGIEGKVTTGKMRKLRETHRNILDMSLASLADVRVVSKGLIFVLAVGIEKIMSL